jgi:hypothetical protein
LLPDHFSPSKAKYEIIFESNRGFVPENKLDAYMLMCVPHNIESESTKSKNIEERKESKSAQVSHNYNTRKKRK